MVFKKKIAIGSLLSALTLSVSAGDYELRLPFTTEAPSDSDASGLTLAVPATISFSGYYISGGAVYSSGTNNYGQLGLSNTTSTSVFLPAGIASGALRLASSGQNVGVVKDDGTLWMVGRNLGQGSGGGQFGLGHNTSISTFTKTPLTDVADVDMDNQHTLALLTNGTVWGAGFNNTASGTPLGFTDNIEKSAFEQTSLSGITAIEAGILFSLALDSSKRVWFAGNNARGQGGLGTAGLVTGWVQIPVDNVIKISADNWQSFVIRQDPGTNIKSLWAAGENSDGELGIGHTTDSPTFIYTGLDGVIDVGTGWHYSAALKDDGTVWAAGRNGVGQFGNGSTSNTPQISFIQLPITDVEAISVGHTTLSVLKTDGSVWAAGRNTTGAMGLGHTASQSVFVEIANPDPG